MPDKACCPWLYLDGVDVICTKKIVYVLLPSSICLYVTAHVQDIGHDCLHKQS
jgi:hypothetical protein